MARVISSKIGRTDGVATANFVPSDWWEASEQATGDVFLLSATNDTGTTALSISGGWTELHGPAPNNSGCRTGVWWIRHTGTEITAPTITGANDDWAVTMVQIRGVDPTVQIEASAVTEQTTSTQKPTAPTATSITANALVLRILGGDGNGTALQANGIGQGVSAARTSDNPLSSAIAIETQIEWQIQPTPGAVGTYAWERAVLDGGRQLTLILRPAAGAPVPAYPFGAPTYPVAMLATSPTVSLLSTWHATLLGGKTVRDGSASGGAIRNQVNPQNVSALAAGMYGYARDIGQTQTITTGLAGIYGAAFALPATTDFTTGLISTALAFPSISATVANSGPLLYFRDSGGNFALIRPYSEAIAAADAFRPFVSYLPDETQVDGGGLINWAQITHIGCAIDVTGTIATAAQRAVQFRPVLRIPLTGGACPIVGGNAANPFSFRDIANVLNSGTAYRSPSIQGSKQQLFLAPFQIGDGTRETFFGGDATAAEFADLAFRGARYRSNDLEARIRLGASDVFRLGAASIGSGLQQKLTVDSASSTSATYDFSGTVFGMAVTLKTGIAVSGTTFAGCGEIDAQGADVETCAVVGTTSADTAIAFSANASLAGTTVDVTGTSASHHIELGASVTSLDLTDADLIGTPGTSNIKVLRTTGTVTIALGLGQPVPTYTSSGATVVFTQPQATAQVVGLVAGSMVEVFNVDTATVVHRAIVAGTSWSLSYDDGTTFTNGDSVRVRIAKVSGATAYEPEEYAAIATASGWTVGASQSLVKTQAAAYNAWSIDGTAITKLSQDNTNIDIDIVSATTGEKKELAAWWMAQLMTVAGIRDFWNAFAIESVASIRQNVSVVDVKIQNTVAGTSFNFTDNDVRYYRSDYSTPFDVAPGYGSVFMDYGGVPLTVEVPGSGLTPSESAQLLALGTPAQNATQVLAAAAATPIKADVQQMNGADVIGTGTTGDAWRGVGVSP